MAVVSQTRADGIVWAFVIAVGAPGCMIFPAGPGGPLQPQGTVQFSHHSGYAAAPARAALTSADGIPDTAVHDDHADAQNVPYPFPPARGGARVSPIDWWDVAVDAGWLDAGVETRVGVPEHVERLFPMALSFSARTGAAGLRNLGNRGHWELRSRIELYPWLAKTRHGRARAILALGASTGERFHLVAVPDVDDEGEGYPGFVDTLGLLRQELRVEAVGGVELRWRRMITSAIVTPYVIPSAREPKFTACNGCSWRLVGYEQHYGAAVILSLGAALGPEPR